MFRPLIPLALSLLAACNPFGCDEEREVIETVPSSPFYQSQLTILQSFRDNGWRCADDGSVQTPTGAGTRYVCTRCR